MVKDSEKKRDGSEKEYENGVRNWKFGLMLSKLE